MDEIKELTQQLVKQHGRGQIEEFVNLTGLHRRTFDYYRTGSRQPDRFLLYFIEHEAAGSPLGEWAAKCSAVRTQNGNGIPE